MVIRKYYDTYLNGYKYVENILNSLSVVYKY